MWISVGDLALGRLGIDSESCIWEHFGKEH
jgi:hypothetical protein